MGSVIAALAAAMMAAWAPATRFSLVCTGTQTGYQERGAVKLAIPWMETFTIDLAAGTYCSQGCVRPEPIAAVTATALDLANSSSPADGSSSRKHFQVSGGAYSSAEVTGGAGGDRFHLEKTGTCAIGS